VNAPGAETPLASFHCEARHGYAKTDHTCRFIANSCDQRAGCRWRLLPDHALGLIEKLRRQQQISHFVLFSRVPFSTSTTGIGSGPARLTVVLATPDEQQARKHSEQRQPISQSLLWPPYRNAKPPKVFPAKRRTPFAIDTNGWRRACRFEKQSSNYLPGLEGTQSDGAEVCVRSSIRDPASGPAPIAIRGRSAAQSFRLAPSRFQRLPAASGPRARRQSRSNRARSSGD
jgi:hypothetical protein